MKKISRKKIQTVLDWIICVSLLGLSLSAFIELKFLISGVLLLISFLICPFSKEFLAQKGIKLPQSVLLLILFLGLFLVIKIQ